MKRLTTLMLLCGVTSLSLMACEAKPKSDKEFDKQAMAEQAEAEPVKEEVKQEVVEPAAAAEPVEVTAAKVGEAAPDFLLMDQDGKEVRLSEFKGRPVVLEWTEKSCPYVVRHYTDKTMPKTLEAAGGMDKVAWLAIDSSHFVKSEEVAAWRTEQELDYPVLLDASGKVGMMYGAKNTPHMFVIDKEGVLRYSGAVDDDPRGEKSADERVNYISETLRALEEGKDIEQAETKPYGCSVKYKS